MLPAARRSALDPGTSLGRGGHGLATAAAILGFFGLLFTLVATLEDLWRQREAQASPRARAEHKFDGQARTPRAAWPAMRTIRTWLAFRREGRGLSLWAVARGWS